MIKGSEENENKVHMDILNPSLVSHPLLVKVKRENLRMNAAYFSHIRLMVWKTLVVECI